MNSLQNKEERKTKEKNNKETNESRIDMLEYANHYVENDYLLDLTLVNHFRLQVH